MPNKIGFSIPHHAKTVFKDEDFEYVSWVNWGSKLFRKDQLTQSVYHSPLAHGEGEIYLIRPDKGRVIRIHFISYRDSIPTQRKLLRIANAYLHATKYGLKEVIAHDRDVREVESLTSYKTEM